MTSGLNLEGLARLLGVSCRGYLAIARSDRRIVTTPSLDTAGSVTRLRRWIAAGSPVADLARLSFRGSDEVRALVLEVLGRVPVPVAWHAIEHVSWFEVGRRATGWQGVAAPIRAPEGDQAHVVALCGAAADESLRDVIAHELGHSWSCGACPTAPSVERMSQVEWTARQLVAAKIVGLTPDRLARERIADEKLADALAVHWGFRRSYTDDDGLSRMFADDHAAAAELAASVEIEVEAIDSGAGIANRTAACTGS